MEGLHISIFKLNNAANIEEKTLHWLWPGLIPRGQCCLIEGDPGCRKSTLAVALAAHVSKGIAWPDGNDCPKGVAIICNAEDPEEQVQVPRLRAAGADLNKIFILSSASEEQFTIPDHVEGLKALVKEKQWPVRLIIFDPLEAYLSGAVDNYRNHHVRRALRSVEQLATELDCAIIFVRHLNKATDKAAIYRGGGSIGIIGAARAALAVAHDKTTPDRSIVVPVKQNWAKVRGGIAYKSVEVKYTTASGQAITTSRIEWDGEIDVSADDIIMADAAPEEHGALEEAADFIREQLSSGAVKVDDIIKAAGSLNINRKTLWRASKRLGVHKFKSDGWGADGYWLWEMPSDADVKMLKDWAVDDVSEGAS